jgi:hypothetical protein
MAFHPTVDSVIRIDSVDYQFVAHPTAINMPYGQSGRQAIVFQLRDSANKFFGLKIFHDRFRVAELSILTEQQRQFCRLSGLRVCERKILTPQHHGELISAHPELKYAILMPWIQGETWFDIISDKVVHDPSISKRRALNLAMILTELEERAIAHCDISGANVLVMPEHTTPLVQLVDVEQMYAPTIQPPGNLLAGSGGYAHKIAKSGVWNELADRFAGAILLAEMLGWCVPEIVQCAYGEQYFAPDEMHQPTDRYRLLHHKLHEHWGEPVSRLLHQAWGSNTLADCPALCEWRDALGAQGSSDGISIVQQPVVAPLPRIKPEPQPVPFSYELTFFKINENQLKQLDVDSDTDVAGKRPFTRIDLDEQIPPRPLTVPIFKPIGDTEGPLQANKGHSLPDKTTNAWKYAFLLLVLLIVIGLILITI